jgi:hypothetical protein
VTASSAELGPAEDRTVETPRERVERSRRESGVPVALDDPAVIAQLAEIFGAR